MIRVVSPEKKHPTPRPKSLVTDELTTFLGRDQFYVEPVELLTFGGVFVFGYVRSCLVVKQVAVKAKTFAEG